MNERQRNERINLLLKLVMAILFMTGAVIFSYPFVVDAINNYYDQKMIERIQLENEERFLQEREERLAEMARQNEELLKNKQTTNIPGMGLVEDPFEAVVGQDTNPGREYFAEHTVGAIYIPAIHVRLPLFDETNYTLLEKGATVLQGTSFPIGGDNTHSVITGHSGLPNKLLFTELEKLVKGDQFYIDIAGEKLAYQIESFKTVLPHEIDDLVIQDGRDLVTLLTCTPYMINTHRLLVTAVRIPYVEEVMEKEKEQTQVYHKNRFRLFMLGIPIFFGLIFYWMWRKFVFYQSGKYTYDFCFTLLKNGQPESGIVFTLVDRRKEPLIENEKVVTIASDEQGVVRFSQVRGGIYWAQAENQKSLPKIKGYMYLLKHQQFRIRSRRKVLTKKKCNGRIIYQIERGKQ